MFRKYLTRLLFSLCLTSTISCIAQTDSINNVIDFSIDGFGNLYVAKKNSEFVKLNSEGKTIRVNSRKDLGIPNSINAENPLRILIFYREQGWLVVADNQLAFQFEVDLKQQGFTDPTLVANSFDGGIWVFDRGNGSLNKMIITVTGIQHSGSIDLRQILYTALNPHQLYADGNYLVLSNENLLYVFDRYGTYIRKIALDGIPSTVNLEGNMIMATTQNSLFSCDLRYLTPPNKYEQLEKNVPLKIGKTSQNNYELLQGGLLKITSSKK